jgi:2-polyprenyl-3-methyl-5-hydroxy-6-metoxy-1,4-benzoquinol methylase
VDRPSTIAQCPTLKEQAAFFDDWNARWRAPGFDDIEPECKARGAKVLELLHDLPMRRPSILEIGCGTGWLTEKLTSLGNVTALDLSEKAIAIAKERGADAEFIAGDFYTQSLSPRLFDVGVCVETLSCVPDQPGFVDKLAALIKPGGCVIVTAQNKFVYERRSDIGPPKNGQIRRWLSRNDLHRLLQHAFCVLKSVTILPKGDKGLLRIINSYKLNRVLRCLVRDSTIVRIQEKLGLGHCRVVLAQRRGP